MDGKGLALLTPEDADHDVAEDLVSGREQVGRAGGEAEEQLLVRSEQVVRPRHEVAQRAVVELRDHRAGVAGDVDAAESDMLAWQRKLKAAGFPYPATLEQFDFSLRPELKRSVMVRFSSRIKPVSVWPAFTPSTTTTATVARERRPLDGAVPEPGASGLLLSWIQFSRKNVHDPVPFGPGAACGHEHCGADPEQHDAGSR